MSSITPAETTRGTTGAATVRTAVVIPVGKGDDASDTLDSVLAFVPPPRLVVLVDDTAPGSIAGLADSDDDVVVVPAKRRAPGGQGGLWVKLCQGFRLVAEAGQWDVIMRMDADALVTGPGIELIAAQRFGDDPGLGLLGAFRTGPQGGTRDWQPAVRQMAMEMGPLGCRHPRLRSQLRRLRRLADQRGYEPGAHALGGAYLISPTLLDAWHSTGWLDLGSFRHSRLGEDHIAGLLSYAAAYHIEDLSGPDDPMAITWRGLGAPPSVLLKREKLVVHSVRSHGEMSEAGIRAVFRDARGAPGPGRPDPARTEPSMDLTGTEP